MANKSGWKDSERKAALLFPGGKRRLRVMLERYDEVADDVEWGPELKKEIPAVIDVDIRERDPKTGKLKKTGKTRKMKIVQPHVIKLPLVGVFEGADEEGCCYRTERQYGPVYIEVKKRDRSETVRFFKESAEKYFRGDKGALLALIQHVKGDQHQFVTVRDDWFMELIRAWCRERHLFLEEMALEEGL